MTKSTNTNPHNPYQRGRQAFREGISIQDVGGSETLSYEAQGWLDELTDKTLAALKANHVAIGDLNKRLNALELEHKLEQLYQPGKV